MIGSTGTVNCGVQPVVLVTPLATTVPVPVQPAEKVLTVNVQPLSGGSVASLTPLPFTSRNLHNVTLPGHQSPTWKVVDWQPRAVIWNGVDASPGLGVVRSHGLVSPAGGASVTQ